METMLIEELISYRIPLCVTKIIVLLNNECFPICPRCNCSLEREYQNFCDRCGQRLCWSKFSCAKVVNFNEL